MQIQAKDISPYKHALLLDGHPAQVESVKHSKDHDTMIIHTVNDVSMIVNPIAMVSVQLIGDDPDPSEPTPARDQSMDTEPEGTSWGDGVSADDCQLEIAA